MPAPTTLASFNALVASLARSGRPAQALHTFRDMLARGFPPDYFTLPPVLRSCALTGSAALAASSHALSVKLGAHENLFVASALVLCYAGLSNLSDARRLFDGMRDRDSVLWTSMLSTYAQGGKPEEALRFFQGMVVADVELDAVVMVSLLLACGQLGWHRHGRSVHACCIRMFATMPLSLGNALVDMYIKCGELVFAERVFDVMPRRDVISWSALIVGHGLNGRPDIALRLFDEMAVTGVEQNSVTYLGALSACAHSGMVDKAYAIFELMKQQGIKPELKHYSCMADTLGRAGRVVEAVNLIEEMPCQPDEAMLGSVLAACRVYGEMDTAERISKRLMGMSPAKSGYYMSLANIYSDAGRYVDAERIRGFMKDVKGNRRYIPLQQPTAQQAMIDTISAGPTTVILIGSHTNFAIFLLTYPHLKRNVEHLYIMGGGMRSKNPTGCCPKDVTTSCTPQQCGDIGNLFSSYNTNPNAEFNIFGDPFAAYQVFHSGIPITLVPLDATNTIPVNEEFFYALQQHQSTFEAEYCFKSLKMARDTWFDDQFHSSYFMWDSLTSGIAISSMRNDKNCQYGNDFAELEYKNITVITSNRPYGVNDGSNPLFYGRAIPKFGLKMGGVHSGHIQTGITDSFCLVKGSRKGRCEDGYTKEMSGQEAVHVCVATKAKPNTDKNSPLDREFFKSFLEVLTLREDSGRFNIMAQFPFYREVLYKPDFVTKSRGRLVIFDMDMSPGDFVSLIFLLKASTEVIDLKGILVSNNGWANAASIDIIYDILHMMGRDDIPVGRGNTTALDTPTLGCMYASAIPQGSGGLIDSDTLYGLARSLPRSPRRYTAENSVEHGAPRNTDNPQLRQPLAFEVWQSVKEQLGPGEKITILTNGPLTNLANIVLSDRNATSVIKGVYVVGGNIRDENNSMGNVFTVPSNKYAEFNMFLDPLAAKTVLESTLDITLIPLGSQRKVASFPSLLAALKDAEYTPELSFVLHLLSSLHDLRQKHQLYHHMDIFLGELLGAVYLVEQYNMKQSLQLKPISIIANSTPSMNGQVVVDKSAKSVKVLVDLSSEEYYNRVASSLSNKERSAAISSFAEQKAIWNRQPENLEV